jgi:hypothetical protein
VRIEEDVASGANARHHLSTRSSSMPLSCIGLPYLRTSLRQRQSCFNALQHPGTASATWTAQGEPEISFYLPLPSSVACTCVPL